MLVLSRQRDEVILLTIAPCAEARTVKVICVDIRGDKVRLGIQADKSIAIHRAEVQAAIEREAGDGT